MANIRQSRPDYSHLCGVERTQLFQVVHSLRSDANQQLLSATSKDAVDSTRGAHKESVGEATLETPRRQIDGFFSQLPFKCFLPEVASVGYRLKICPWVVSRVV